MAFPLTVCNANLTYTVRSLSRIDGIFNTFKDLTDLFNIVSMFILSDVNIVIH